MIIEGGPSADVEVEAEQGDGKSHLLLLFHSTFSIPAEVNASTSFLKCTSLPSPLLGFCTLQLETKTCLIRRGFKLKLNRHFLDAQKVEVSMWKILLACNVCPDPSTEGTVLDGPFLIKIRAESGQIFSKNPGKIVFW